VAPWSLRTRSRGLDRPDEAGACFEELRTLADALDGGSRARGFAFAHLAVGYARLGMREQAAGCYDKLLPFRGMVSPILVDRGSPWRRWLAVISLLHEALRRCRRSRPQDGLASGAWRLRCCSTGFLSGAVRVRDEGLQLCEELGMQALDSVRSSG